MPSPSGSQQEAGWGEALDTVRKHSPLCSGEVTTAQEKGVLEIINCSRKPDWREDQITKETPC